MAIRLFAAGLVLVASAQSASPREVESSRELNLAIPGRATVTLVVATKGAQQQQRVSYSRPDNGVILLAQANFTGATLNGANFRNANLRGAIFNKIDWSAVEECEGVERVEFSGVELDGADLGGAYLEGIDFTDGVTFQEANLKGSKLRCAVFDCADMQGQDLSGADLTGTSFFGTELSNETRQTMKPEECTETSESPVPTTPVVE